MTPIAESFRSRFGLEFPLVQAPMAGSVTPELVAAVSNAGGLGSLGAAYMTPEQITEAVAEIRRRTDRPFQVNLFAGGYPDHLDPVPAASTAALAILRRHYAALGLDLPESPRDWRSPFAAQFEAVLAAKPPMFSFTFGIPSASDIQRLRQSGTFIAGTATTVREALLLRSAGVDAVVAQGSEAGAHRGSFAVPFEESMIGTMALVPQVVDAVPDLPVIASGGIMDGRGIAAALCLGAAGVAMGTAFLACDEAAVPNAYKAMLSGDTEETTVVTRAFSGRPARGIPNAFIAEIEEAGDSALLPFPLQNTLTRAMRTAAAKADDTDRMSLWAGQGFRMARRMPAAELVRLLIEETKAAIARFERSA